MFVVALVQIIFLNKSSVTVFLERKNAIFNKISKCIDLINYCIATYLRIITLYKK